jgi:hypothetical protein
MEFFYQKFGGVFPKKSKMSQIYKTKKNSKIFPIFVRKEQNLSKENHWSSQSDYPFAMIG